MLTFNYDLARRTGNLPGLTVQMNELNALRNDSRHALPSAIMAANDAKHAGLVMATNAGLAPQDLYREFDSQTIAQMHLDEGEVLLNDLMALSRSLPIGRLTYSQARSSGVGNFQTSISGLVDIKRDSADYDYQSTLIPVHQNGFQRDWREAETLSLEGFTDLLTQQEEAVRTHKKGLVAYLLDGTSITYEGASWAGFRSDSSVDQVDLGVGGVNFNFTDRAQTGEATINAFLTLAERRYVNNNITASATWYVSSEIYWALQRPYSDNFDSGSVMDKLIGRAGIGEIKVTSALTGNQILSMPLSREYIQLLTGMAVSTYALPRPSYNSPLAFDVVCAMGVNVKNDFAGTNSGVQYAAS